jgi:hypothetical protein
MPVSMTVLRKAIQDWGQSILPGVTVIWAEQNAPRPQGEFVTLKIISGPIKIGRDESRISETIPGQLDIIGHRSFIVSINSYGGDALVLLLKLQDSLSLLSVRDPLSTAGLTVNDVGNVRDVTAVVDTRFERRANLEVTFSYVTTYDENPGYIEKVSVAENYLDGDGSSQITRTSTVSIV